MDLDSGLDLVWDHHQQRLRPIKTLQHQSRTTENPWSLFQVLVTQFVNKMGRLLLNGHGLIFMLVVQK